MPAVAVGETQSGEMAVAVGETQSGEMAVVVIEIHFFLCLQNGSETKA